jgi:type II secretory pathway component GspD/PulD (secretin)
MNTHQPIPPSPASRDANAVGRSCLPGRAASVPCRCAFLLAAVLAAGTLFAAAQASRPVAPEVAAPGMVAATNTISSAPADTVQAQAPVAPANEAASAGADGTSTNGLRLNFRNAPIDLVLNYLSDAAGFIIEMDTPVRGNVSVISSHPMTADEAVDLVNSVLNKNGYAAIRNGRTLIILDKNEAKTRDIPVKVSNDPGSIPKNDEIVTQIIPIRFVEARQLVTDLSPFVSAQATIVANEAGNSIVITDTQSNIRHLVEIIKAIDSSAEGETEIRVFHLSHASPTDVANELGQIFPSNNNATGNNQAPIRFGGGGGGPGGFFQRMMAANAAPNVGSSQNSRVQKQSQVIAVADLRTSSVVVTASKDLMTEIAGMMEQLDVTSTRDQKVFVYHMDNGDPQQALTVLQTMFQNNSTSRSGTSSSSSSSALANRETQNAATIGNSSSSGNTGTGTGMGGGGARVGGGGTTF